MWSCAGGGRAKRRSRSPDERGLNLQLLAGFALRNGEVTPSVINALVKACSACGIEEGEVYRQLHALPLEDSGTVLARGPSRAVEHDMGASSDAGGDDVSPGVVLDSDRLQRRLTDTAHAHALLGEVFSETEGAGDPDWCRDAGAEATSTPAANDDHLLVGLDSAHGRLAVLLAQQSAWPLAEAAAAAESIGLPLWSGAADTINEAAIDLCGEPLVEGDDPVTLNEYAVAEAMGHA